MPVSELVLTDSRTVGFVPRSSARRASSALAVLVVMGAALSPGAAGQARAQATVSAVRYDVPAGPLAEVLNRFAQQSGVSIALDANQIRGLESPGIQGSHDVDEGFGMLLRGSGHVAEKTAGGYVLRPVAAARAGTPVSAPQGGATLPAVLVSSTVDASAGAVTEGSGSYAARSASASTRMDLSLRETPQSVSVIGRQQIEDQNLTTLDDVLRQAPGVVSDRLDERVIFTSRGFELNKMVDGVPTLAFNSVAGEYSMVSTALYDRVEIVRGPGGLLNGVGDPGGVINLIRKRPTSGFSGQVTAGVGSWNRHHVAIDVGGPLNAAGTLRARWVASRIAGDGFVESKKTAEDVFYGIVEADLASSTRLTVGVEHQKTAIDGANFGQSPLFFSDGSRTDLRRSFSSSARWSNWDMYADKVFVGLAHRFDNGWQLRLDASYLKTRRKRTSGDLNIYYPVDASGDSTIDIRDNPADAKNRSFDAFVKGPFEAFGRVHDAVVGVSYNRYDYRVDTNMASSGYFDTRPLNFYRLQDFPKPASFPYASYTLSGATTEKAIYGSTRLKPWGPLSVILGARATWYEDASTNRSAPAGTTTASEPARERGVVTPYAGIVYDLSHTYSTYASYADIFRPNTVRDAGNALLPPRRGKNYEIGIKGEHFDGGLNTSLGVFRTREENIAVEDARAGPLPDGSIPYRAVSGARSQGYEVAASGEPVAGWQVMASFTRHVKRDGDGSPLNPTYPRRLLRVGTAYRLPGQWHKLTIGGSLSYQSDIHYDEYSGLGRATQAGLTLIGLMARYAFDEHLSATLNIENLTDKRYYAGLGGYNGYTYGNPRNAWVRLQYKF
ncbi:MAG: TonB-dependent siderophore receptor [Burkholderiaceae bacterium]